jgi:hypothetical protein
MAKRGIQDTGVPPSGSGLRPDGLRQSPLSQAEPLVPNADRPRFTFRISEASRWQLARLLRVSADYLDNCNMTTSAQLERRAAELLLQDDGGDRG